MHNRHPEMPHHDIGTFQVPLPKKTKTKNELREFVLQSASQVENGDLPRSSQSLWAKSPGALEPLGWGGKGSDDGGKNLKNSNKNVDVSSSPLEFTLAGLMNLPLVRRNVCR